MEMFDRHPAASNLNILFAIPWTNMEPKNEHMEDEIPFEKHHVQVPC